MKAISYITAWVLLPIAMITINGCLDHGMKGDEEVNTFATDSGVIVVDTITINATVVAKDMDKGTITLASDAGGKNTYKAGKDIDDISVYNIGDLVTAVVTEEMALFVGVAVPDAAMAAGGVMIAPDGSAAGEVVQAEAITGVVTAVDAKKHKVTFAMEDGTSETVKVNKKIDLTLLPVGETVTVQVGQALALSILK